MRPWCAGCWIMKSKIICPDWGAQRGGQFHPHYLSQKPRKDWVNSSMTMCSKQIWWRRCILGGGNSNISVFSPRKLGKWWNLMSIVFKTGLIQPPTSITWIWRIWVTMVEPWLLRCQVIMTLDRRFSPTASPVGPGGPKGVPCCPAFGGSNSQRAGFVSFQMGWGNLKKTVQKGVIPWKMFWELLEDS